MTASNRPSILATARSDPIGAGIIVCVVALVTLLILHFAPRSDIEAWRWRMPFLSELLSPPRRLPRPLPSPPMHWRLNATPADTLTVPGFPVAYWGRPDAPYSAGMTAGASKPVAIIVHFTDETPALSLVRYGHSTDDSRGGVSYGYHIYIDEWGRVLQGAPLSKRTNHVKPGGHEKRRAGTTHMDSRNTIGVSLIGACKSPRLSPVTYRCTEETPTPQQMEAGLAVVSALRRKYSIKCGEVYGHGDLQTDRASFEGHALSRKAREVCG